MVENIRNGKQTIGTTSLEVVPTLMQGQRTALTIINTSTGGQIVTLNWGGEARALEGIVLYPGGSWSESRDAFFKPSIETVWGISSAASATIAIHERVETQGV